MPAVTPSFVTKLAAAIGAPAGYLAQFLAMWQPHEGGDAAFNPLNTTESGGEDPNNPFYNTFGDGYHVRNYANEDAGAAATARTLMNGNFPNLLAGLRAGNVNGSLAAPEIRKWGTTGFADQLDGGTTNVGGSNAPSSPEDVQYWQNRAEYNQLNSAFGLWLKDPTTAQQLGIPKPTPDQIQRLLFLDSSLQDYEDQHGGASGSSPGDIKTAYDLYNSTDPRVIDAQNAASKYARQFTERTEAASEASNALQAEQQQARDAYTSQKSFMDSAAPGGGPRMGGFTATPAQLQNGEELYQKALDRIKNGLPDVPDMPYPSRPASVASVLNGGKPGQGPRPVDTGTPTFPGAPTSIAGVPQGIGAGTGPLPAIPGQAQQAAPISFNAQNASTPRPSSFSLRTQTQGIRSRAAAAEITGSIFSSLFGKPKQPDQGAFSFGHWLGQQNPF